MRNASAIAIGGGAIALSLIETLIERGVLTKVEGRRVLERANAKLQPFLDISGEIGREGTRIIGETLQALSAEDK